MGNSTLRDRSLVEKGYILETQASTLFLGDYCVLLNPNTSARLIRKQQYVDSAKSIEEIERCVKGASRTHLNIVFPHEAAKGKHLEAICRGVRVTLYYRWMGLTLKGEIEGKKARKQHFTENEAWFILNELSRALEQLAERALAHWDIRPENIYKNHNDNYYLYDPTYLRGGIEFLGRKLETGHYCNLSREAIESITYTGGMDFEMAQSNDMFATGLTVLELLTMKDPNCYYRGKTVSEADIMEDLEELSGKYSKGLLKILGGMLAKQKKRIQIDQLRKILRPKEFEIVRQSKFYEEDTSPSVANSQHSSEFGWVPQSRRHQMGGLISPPPKDSKISLANYNRNPLVSPRRRDSEYSSNSTVPVSVPANNSHRVTQTLQNSPKFVFNNTVMAYQAQLCRWDRHNRKE